MKYQKLFTPIKIGNVELPNRYAMAPMGPLGLGDCEGLAVARAQNYCRTGATATPARPAPATLPPSFLAAPAGESPATTKDAGTRGTDTSEESAP